MQPGGMPTGTMPGGQGQQGQPGQGGQGGQGGGSDDDEKVEKAKEIPAQELLQWVRSQIGKPYVFGADGPGSYDCSGLVLRAYGRYGVKMNHKAADQAGYGRPVGKGSAMPGDLIFFNLGRGRNSHVGIISGEGKFIEAPRTGLNVRETTLNDWYKARITAVRRIPQVIQGQGSGTATRGQSPTGGSGARPARPGQPTPSGTGSVGTGSATPGATGGTGSSGNLGQAASTVTGAAANAVGQAGQNNQASDTFGVVADAIKEALAPLNSLTAFSDKILAAFFPTMLVRVACAVAGVVCLLIGIMLIAREGPNNG